MEPARLENCAAMLERNGFRCVTVPTVAAAGEFMRSEIERLAPQTVSYGDSLTLYATGTVEWLRERAEYGLIDGFDKALPREQQLERRREGLLADVFLTGINALSMKGTLHWLDMIGNRIAPVAFGPRHVILVAGRNKICDSPAAAEERIKLFAAPANAARHEGFRTPCVATGTCADCRSPQRICNTHMIMERCYPKGRITVVLVDEDVGL